ncbi:MAG: protein translocase subunit SecD [Pseudomonadota bacterium]
MNHYAWWKNLLVAAVVVIGIVVALPNYFGTAPALQISAADGVQVSDAGLQRYARILTDAGAEPAKAYLDEGRAVLRYRTVDEQLTARQILNDALDDSAVVTYAQSSLSPPWLRTLGLKPMSLGLDLRGGVHFLFEVDLDAAISKRLELYVQSFEEALRDANIRRRVDLDGNVIRVRLQSADDVERARQVVGQVDDQVEIATGGDGRSLLVRMTDQQIRERQDFAIDQNTITLRNRVNELGVAEPLVQRQGQSRIVVQLPGVQDPAEADRIISATATLEFRLVDQEGDGVGSQRYPFREGGTLYLKREVIASGDQIINASSTFSEGQPAVSVRLDAVGGARMLDTTQTNVGNPMGVLFIETKRRTVIVDGEEVDETYQEREVINNATIRGVFSTNFQITGLNPLEARDLALLLRAGSLAAPIFKVEERTIGPTLGQENIDRGFNAVAIGFLAVIVFMAFYYRAFGLIANMALLTNLVMIVALLSLLQASLTLPGIAGIVLTVGMAVDANVLIFERIREELTAGRSPQVAISSGYDKAFSSIADANVTTLIAAVVLFAFGTGPIKGFAVTLSLGIVTSMFTAIIGTRAVVNAAFGGRELKGLPV